MLVSTRGRYAIRVMIDLAEHRPVSYTHLDVYKRQAIDELVKVMQKLMK